MPPAPTRAAIPKISAPTLAFFRRIVRGYFRRSFHAVRVLHPERLEHVTGPLILYANHASWWDPMVSFHLAATLLPQRPHYAPMDSAALARYPILARLGIFPVAIDSPRGAVQFLRTGSAILASGGVLWITPQGRFVDPRDRPLTFKPGLAALAARAAETLGACTLLPLAIEYPFWDERTPECLLHFGDPIHLDNTTTALEGQLESALTTAMDHLQQAAMRRNPFDFTTLTQGRVGTGGFYALGQRLKALLTRRTYVPEHTIHPEHTAEDGSRG